MNIPIFELERVQSLYENTVEFNLTESGFHPFTLNEILNDDQHRILLNTTLGYGQTNGAIGCRKAIANLYEGFHEENILVTNGSSEANFVACHTLLERGDEMIMMIPNYMQMWGIAEEMGVKLKSWHLREENGWAPDLDELESLVGPKTKMIAICNPNNPTGYVLTEQEMKKIVILAESVGAWVYCDEIYRGAELNGIETPSFVGMYDKVLVNGGLSKAYALPGLRTGWLAGPERLIADTWAYHDYTSITAGILSHQIAEWVLEPQKRAWILSRNRQMLKDNLAAVLSWVNNHGDLFGFIPPKAGGMAFMRYHLDVNSTDLATFLRTEKDVFIVAGDCYGMDKYIRIGVGSHLGYLLEGLNRMDDAIKTKYLL